MKQAVKNQSGQLVLEGILLMAVITGISLAAVRFFHDREIASKLVSDPWARLAGMIECGTWSPCGPGLHPMTTNPILSKSPKEY